MSLRTRGFREAEHRAALLDTSFHAAFRRAQATVTTTTDLNSLLRQYLLEALDADLRQRLDRPAGTPVYAHWWEPGDPGTAAEADLRAIRRARDSLRADLQNNNPMEMEEHAEHLIEKHGLSPSVLGPLTYGLIEAAIRKWEVAERRTLGTERLVFQASEPESHQSPTEASSKDAPEEPPKHPASSFLDAFGEWGRASAGWRSGSEGQALTSTGLFLEICGDRPIDTYGRSDGDQFRSTLRKLPATYRKSAKDKDRPLGEIIAEADAKNALRLTDKTIRRHFWGVSRFFHFLVETGRLQKDADNPARGFTFNTKGSARRQRDMWAGDELRRLFSSPVWTGCHSFYRAQAGTEIIRDSLFWLPLLGLFHGNRLEEFAQLRRQDVAFDGSVWCISITDEDGLQLKNDQSRRIVPLHSELIRIGFLTHIQEIDKTSGDRIFPDLRPGGKDRKLGYYFSKEFTAYRKNIGVYRKGLDYHAFRHGVTTKLYEADVSEGWIDLLTGHESGGESRRRYLKGISPALLQSAIEKVQWPEIDLSHLYIPEADHESGAAAATRPTAAE